MRRKIAALGAITAWIGATAFGWRGLWEETGWVKDLSIATLFLWLSFEFLQHYKREDPKNG